MYAVLPSRIEPGFGYIYVYRPDQCPAPVQGSPNPTQTILEVSQYGENPYPTPTRSRRGILAAQAASTRTLWTRPLKEDEIGH